MPLLVNSTPVPVDYRDGKSETIEIGELTLRQLHRFIAHVGADDTPQMVSLCAGKPIEWIDTLTDASYTKLAGVCFNANFQRAAGLMQSDLTVRAKLMPLCLKLAQTEDSLLAYGMIGREQLPAPASTESKAEVGSESSTSPQADSSSLSESSPG